MATVHKLPVSTLNSASSSYEPSRADGAASDRFPAGLRVLVVDDDTTCLRILEQMLKKCLYRGYHSVSSSICLMDSVVNKKHFGQNGASLG
ncbi:hypothetical protein ACLOJK_007050 [Asimina triloba]